MVLNIMKTLTLILFIILTPLLISIVSGNICHEKQIKNKAAFEGFVPNKAVARQIAEAILLPIYGDEILNQKPFEVSLLKDSIWVVTGIQKEVSIGGVVYMEIQKSDCKILKVTHGK
jgi:hypothetical protein